MFPASLYLTLKTISWLWTVRDAKLRLHKANKTLFLERMGFLKMALFKISQGLKANLPAIRTAGYCWYTTDDSLFYIDFEDENGVVQRKALNAKEAETLVGASLATILNSTNLEIPTSKAVLDALNNFGGTVEITNGNPEKENTVLTINPEADEVNVYTVEEVDVKLDEIKQEIKDVNYLLDHDSKNHTNILFWEDGGISSSTGANNSTANRRRTINYIPVEDNLINASSAIKVMIVAYDKSLTFVKVLQIKGGDVWHNLNAGDTLNIKSFIEAGDDVACYRLLINSANGATGEELATASSTYVSENRAGVLSDIEKLQSIVGIAVSEKEYTNYVQWENGSLNANSGNNSDTGSTTRLRTVDFIPTTVSKLIFNKPTSVIVCFYSVDKTFLGAANTSWTACVGTWHLSYLKMPEGSAYFKMALNISNDATANENIAFITPSKEVSGGILNDFEDLYKKKNEIVVDCNGSGDYTTIEDALANANDSETNHVIIRVMQGVYYPAPKKGANNVPYKETNRNLSIIGDNKNKVILRGDCGYYYYQDKIDYAPLRLNGNVVIENLTIESYSSNYETIATENGWDLSSPHCRAYCIHVDGARRAGDVTLIKNCKLVNDHFTTIGFGLRADTTLRIEDCDLIMTVNDDSLSGGSNYGTLYGHLAANETSALNQRLEVLNCRIINNSYSQAINLMDGSGQTAAGAHTASIQLINNICKTTDTQDSFNIVNTNNYYTMDPWCFGNNVAAMNVVQ